MIQGNSPLPAIGYWLPGETAPYWTPEQIAEGVHHTRVQTYVIRDSGSSAIGMGAGGRFVPSMADVTAPAQVYAVLAILAPQYPEWLGDRSFQEVHQVRFSYIAGEMANGIASEEMVIQMAKHHMLGFFGSAGLPIRRVEQAIDTIQAAIPGRSWGVNLIHTPNEPQMEASLVELYVRKGVRRVSASAFMRMTPAIVAYAAKGLTQDALGHIHRQHYVFAKISQPELARQFMSPPPGQLLAQLLEQGKITAEEARLAARVPVAEDITVEADSGGHTDNRPQAPLFASVLTVRDQCMRSYAYTRPIRIGIAGGIGTPAAVAAAYAQGASYVLVGSVHQSAVESGLSAAGRAMLAQATMTDMVMSPAADMFEQGVKVQVLKRGTMFSSRASQLYDIYRSYDDISDIPEPVRRKIEATIFQQPLEQIWDDTVRFFEQREPSQIDKANRNPKHKMALLFRWYLGQASRWAIGGVEGREYDYQIWCGPAMGAFNAWVQGSYLEPLANRSVTQIAYNMLEGASVVGRAQQLRSYGVPVPLEAFHFQPRKITPLA